MIIRHNIVIALLLGIALKEWEPESMRTLLTNSLSLKTRPYQQT